MKKPTILHITRTNGGGGRERMLFYIQSRLTQLRHYIFFIWKQEQTYDFKPPIFFSWAGKVFKYPPKAKLLRILFYFAINIQLIFLQLKYKFNCILIHDEDMLPYIFPFIKFNKSSKLFLLIHTAYLDTTSRIKKIKTQAFRQIYKIITVSHGLKWLLKKRFSKINLNAKTKVIINPIDYNLVVKLSQRPLPRNIENFIIKKHFTITTIARLSPEKGIINLLRILAEMIHKKQIDVNLIILGSGSSSYTNFLNTVTAKKRIRPNVYFAGFQKNPFNILKHSTIFYLPSSREGLNLSLLESMAIGTPIVTTDHLTGARELLDYSKNYKKLLKKKYVITRYGILTPTMEYINPDDIMTPLTSKERINLDALVFVLKNSSLREKLRRASQKYVKQYSLENVMKLYKNVIKCKRNTQKIHPET